MATRGERQREDSSDRIHTHQVTTASQHIGLPAGGFKDCVFTAIQVIVSHVDPLLEKSVNMKPRPAAS